MCLTLAIHGNRRIRPTAPADSHAAIRAWLRDGDHAAAQWLVDTHRPLVMRVIRGWLPRGWMVEDVVQEVFSNVFRTLHRVDADRRFEAWLCSIARNTCAKALRGWRRRLVFNAGDMGITDFDAFADRMRGPDVAQVDEDEHLAERLLSTLQEDDRRIFWLYHAEGMTAHGVGEKLGLAPGTVRVRVFRSQRALQEAARKMRGRNRS